MFWVYKVAETSPPSPVLKRQAGVSGSAKPRSEVKRSRAACARFYSMTRLLLLLIQVLVFRRLKEPTTPVPLSVNQPDRGAQRAGRLLQHLHCHEALWVEQDLMRSDED